MAQPCAGANVLDALGFAPDVRLRLLFRAAWLSFWLLGSIYIMKRARTFWILLFGIIAAAFVFIGSYPVLRIHYVLARFESAKTSQEERAAFQLLRAYPYRRVDEGMPRVRASEGHEFTFRVQVDTLLGHQWCSASRILLAQTNLDYLTETVLGTHY